VKHLDVHFLACGLELLYREDMTSTEKMRRVVRVSLLLGALAYLGGCVATVGVANASIPKDAAGICQGHCQTIGMHLVAVAIMAENVGCVCQFGTATARVDAAGALSTPAAGMATIAMQEAAAASARAAQRQQQQQAQRRP
jgi:hypothetical protein